MKSNQLSVLLSVICIFSVSTSCVNTSQAETKNILPVFDLTETNDTVNYVDIHGLKQGHWIVYEVNSGNSNLNISVNESPDSINTHKLSKYVNTSGKFKIEEGFYKNDKKTGWWRSFEKNGNPKDSTNYN